MCMCCVDYILGTKYSQNVIKTCYFRGHFFSSPKGKLSFIKDCDYIKKTKNSLVFCLIIYG